MSKGGHVLVTWSTTMPVGKRRAMSPRKFPWVVMFVLLFRSTFAISCWYSPAAVILMPVEVAHNVLEFLLKLKPCNGIP